MNTISQEGNGKDPKINPVLMKTLALYYICYIGDQAYCAVVSCTLSVRNNETDIAKMNAVDGLISTVSVCYMTWKQDIDGFIFGEWTNELHLKDRKTTIRLFTLNEIICCAEYWFILSITLDFQEELSMLEEQALEVTEERDLAQVGKLLNCLSVWWWTLYFLTCHKVEVDTGIEKRN